MMNMKLLAVVIPLSIYHGGSIISDNVNNYFFDMDEGHSDGPFTPSYISMLPTSPHHFHSTHIHLLCLDWPHRSKRGWSDVKVNPIKTIVLSQRLTYHKKGGVTSILLACGVWGRFGMRTDIDSGGAQGRVFVIFFI